MKKCPGLKIVSIKLKNSKKRKKQEGAFLKVLQNQKMSQTKGGGSEHDCAWGVKMSRASKVIRWKISNIAALHYRTLGGILKNGTAGWDMGGN